MNVLEVNDLRLEFTVPGGIVKAVNGVTFNVPAGKTVALVGESGSGKSAIAQAIMGILPANGRIATGSIVFRDPKNQKPIEIASLKRSSSSMRALRGNRMAMIFQEPMVSFSPIHKIGDQIGEALRVHKNAGKPEARSAARAMLKLAGIPNPDRALESYPFELSGGMRQRAMIAMALICHPALLIADEPTTALDVSIQAQILKLLSDLRAELHMSMLLITHDLGVVANLADEMVVIYQGEVMERGPSDDLLKDPRHDYLKGLMNAVPQIGLHADARLKPIREPGTKPTAPPTKPKSKTKLDAQSESVVSLHNVTKRFSTRAQAMSSLPAEIAVAVNGVSFALKRGECLGLVGESGSGKSTIAKLMLAAFAPDAGRVTDDAGGGVALADMSSSQLRDYRRRVQLVFQDPFSSLDPRMTVLDILREPLTIHRIESYSDQIARARAVMNQVGLDERYLRRYPHSFSGGQRQRIGIARALMLSPDVLVCDEPVSALDVSVQAQILNLLKDIKAELGLTYLFITHNLAVVDYMADRIAVMCRGRIVELATSTELFKNPVHPYTKALIAAVPRVEPHARLNLTALMEGRANDPAAWPAPFALTGDEPGVLTALNPHHLVAIAPGMTLDAVA